jgi:SprT-like family
MVLQNLVRLYGNKSYRPNIRDTRIWFNVLNELIFKNKVHKFRYINIKYVRGQCAACSGDIDAKGKYWCALELNPRFRNFETFLGVLAHEMVHSYEFVIEKNIKQVPIHGPSFLKWKDTVKKHGLPFSVAFYNKGGKLNTA